MSKLDFPSLLNQRGLTTKEVVDGIEGVSLASRSGKSVSDITGAIVSGSSLAVTSIKGLQEASTTNGNVYLSLGGRSGWFEPLLATDYTDEIAADTLQGIYIASDDGVHVWVRVFSGSALLDWFGSVGDYDADADTGADDSDAIDAWLNCGFNELSFEGGKSYKTTMEHDPRAKLTITGGESSLYQRDITKPLFNLNEMDGSTFFGGHYSHNMDITDYDIDNGRLFYATVAVDDITLYNVKISKTAQQAVDFESGGDNLQVVLCEIIDTARDGLFLLDCTNPKVSLCTFRNTGDDAIAFAGQSTGAIATSNNIIGSGSYNIGGSGIRFNGSGVASNNIIEDSDLFGIIAAVNTADSTARPDDLILSNNNIKGINQTGVVTAGIGFKNVKSVSCINNNIEMPSVEAHAYRCYGDESESVTIVGGVIKTAKSVFYSRDTGPSKVRLEGVVNQGCTQHVLLESSGDIEILSIIDNDLTEASAPSYFQLYAYTGTIENLETKGNRRASPATVAFNYSDKIVTNHYSQDDQFPTGVYSDTSLTTSVSNLTINGRFGENLTANGSITFNATNTGLIPLGFLATPIGGEVQVTPRTSLGLASYFYVDFVDASNFRVYLSEAPGQDVTLDWDVKIYSPRMVI